VRCYITEARLIEEMNVLGSSTCATSYCPGVPRRNVIQTLPRVPPRYFKDASECDSDCHASLRGTCATESDDVRSIYQGSSVDAEEALEATLCKLPDYRRLRQAPIDFSNEFADVGLKGARHGGFLPGEVIISVQAGAQEVLTALEYFVSSVYSARVDEAWTSGGTLDFTIISSLVPVRVNISVQRCGPLCLLVFKHVSQSDVVAFHQLTYGAAEMLDAKGWQLVAPAWAKDRQVLLPFDDDFDDDF